jgi:molybdopterin converting factor small subunit
LDQAVTAYPKLLGVLPQCSFLLNEVALHDFDLPIPDGSTLDVLPPFAGG